MQSPPKRFQFFLLALLAGWGWQTSSPGVLEYGFFARNVLRKGRFALKLVASFGRSPGCENTSTDPYRDASQWSAWSQNFS